MPHRLYGHVDAAVNYSVGALAARCERPRGGAARRPAADLRRRHRALFQGADAAALPRCRRSRRDPRRRARRGSKSDGAEALHAELAQRDPATAARLSPRDRARIARALEVVVATGRSLADWHREGMPPLSPRQRAAAIFLDADREELYARIDARFDAMLEAGALEEVRALAARQLDPLLPAMKAHGVPWLIRHLRGEISRDEAAAAVCRHPTLRQAAGHLVPPSDAGLEWAKPEEARGWLAAIVNAARDPG